MAASQLGARETQRPAAASPTSSAGVPQRGSSVLGRNDAPVTLVEFADLQCPYCAEWTARTLPTLVQDYVRRGKLRTVFRGLAFIGPDSNVAPRAAIAAGRDNRLWEVVHGLYAEQGAENAGWVTDDALERVAASAGLDADTLRDRSGEAWVDAELEQSSGLAESAGVQGTPAFQVGRTGQRLKLVELRSLEPRGSRRRSTPC